MTLGVTLMMGWVTSVIRSFRCCWQRQQRQQHPNQAVVTERCPTFFARVEVTHGGLTALNPVNTVSVDGHPANSLLESTGPSNEFQSKSVLNVSVALPVSTITEYFYNLFKFFICF